MILSYSLSVGVGSLQNLSCSNQARVSLGPREGPRAQPAQSFWSPQHRLICCGDHGRPLSAPLTEDVARKARRAEGSPSDYDPSIFPSASRILWSVNSLAGAARAVDAGGRCVDAETASRRQP